jgi:uncharacterized protein (DUF58 family)
LYSSRWTSVFIFVLILGVILNISVLIWLSTSLFIVLGIANWWKAHSLDGIVYKRRFFYKRAFPDEDVPVQVEVENKKILPLPWLRVQDPWPKAVGPDNDEILAPSHVPDRGYLTNIFSLRWFERARRKYTLTFRKRGSYTVGPARIDSGDLFGFFEQVRQEREVNYLTVFPKMAPLSEIELPSEDPFGDIRSRRRLFEDPSRAMGIREYHPEDNFRRIHWPATARVGEPQVKVYQPTSAQVVVVCLNASTYARHWEGINPELLEALISTAATLVYQGIQKGYKVGLISNGCLAHSDQPFRIPPGRSHQQLAHLLEALAGVSSVVTAPFERFLLREVSRIPYGSSLVILTAVISPELTETLIKILRHERKITLFSMGQEIPPVISGIQVIHQPFKITDQDFFKNNGSKSRHE